MTLTSLFRRLLHRALVAIGALALTLGCLLVLPLTRVVGAQPAGDLMVRAVDAAALPPPPPPPPPQQEEDEPEEEPLPELAEAPARLDLAQLEVALNAGTGGGWMTGGILAKLTALPVAAGSDALFSLADLDQKPRAVFQPEPVLDAAARRRTPGTVHVLFVVDPHGRVENPIVSGTPDPALARVALACVRQWRFEPGHRHGKPVRFRMRVPITFPRS